MNKVFYETIIMISDSTRQGKQKMTYDMFAYFKC